MIDLLNLSTRIRNGTGEVLFPGPNDETIKQATAYSAEHGLETLLLKQIFDHPDAFNQAMPDATIGDEVFWAIKNGCIVEGLPGIVLYAFDQLWEQTKSPNLMLQQSTATVLKHAFNSSIHVRDVICSFYCPEYVPFEPHRLKCWMGSHGEIYLPKYKRVLLLPAPIFSSIDEDDISSIAYEGNQLTIGGVLLSSIAGFKGVAYNAFDLRCV